MNTIFVDHENQRLLMDRTFAKLSANVRSPEYEILQRVRMDYPNYAVVRREIRKNAGKESYRGLTYEYMEKYIATRANAAANRAAYDEKRLIAQCHSVRYPHIKQWFLETYPEVARFGMSSIEEDAKCPSTAPETVQHPAAALLKNNAAIAPAEAFEEEAA